MFGLQGRLGLSGFGGQTSAPWQQLGQMGQAFAQRAQPRFANQPQQAPQGGMSGLGGMLPMMLGGMGGGGLGGLLGAIPGLPPELAEKLQGILGPQSQQGWGLGTTTTPAAFPPWLQGLFGRLGGR